MGSEELRAQAGALAARARARGLRAVRRLGAHPRVLPLTALLLRARTVRPAPIFFAREALGSRRTCVYRLRASGMAVAIRHRSGDVVTLGEVFHEHDYEPVGDAALQLGDVRRIVDLGANIGLFGVFAAARWPQAQIVGFEPDPANAAVHERTIAINALGRRWRLVRAAAGAQDGSAAFIAGDVALSRLAGAEDASASEEAARIEVPVRDVLAEIAGADLVKMDIEGGEWAILGDARLRSSPPRVLVLEYHPRFCPEADPRGAVEAALGLAGMRTQSIWHRADGHGMLWAWQS
jgi:FkbM family methyltransferase